MNIKIKKILITFSKVFNIINKLLYKKERRIVLYSNRGFRDNLKAIYDYLIENQYNNKYSIICSVNDYRNFSDINVENVKFVNNFIGIFYFLTSKYFFYTHGKYPIKPSKHQMVINLWHGTPLKKIGNLEEHQKDIDYNFFTYILATSEFYVDIMKKAFNCKKEQVKICGHPRNDLLFKPITDENENDKKLILWLPTFRNYDKTNFMSEINDGNIPIFYNHSKMRELDLILEDLKIKVIIKLHPTQKYVGRNYKRYENIKIWTEKELSKKSYHLYQLLGSSDALITDYSSVFFDYLLLNKPIAFTINDIDVYNNRRGFVFDNPMDFMPGFKIFNEENFYEFLQDVSKGFDKFEEDRRKINNLVNHYKDGNNCKRVLKIAGINK